MYIYQTLVVLHSKIGFSSRVLRVDHKDEMSRFGQSKMLVEEVQQVLISLLVGGLDVFLLQI